MEDILAQFPVTEELQGDLDIRELKNRNSNEVTMGTGLPHQGEGKAGDISVRQLPGYESRVYIKTNSGWYDLSIMTSPLQTEWTTLNLASTNWAHNTAGSLPAFFKDANGFVHLRGAIANASGSATDNIATLPTGFRPLKTLIVAGAIAGGQTSIQITNAGVINIANGGNTTLSFLDGVLFYSTQDIRSSIELSTEGTAAGNINRGTSK